MLILKKLPQGSIYPQITQVPITNYPDFLNFFRGGHTIDDNLGARTIQDTVQYTMFNTAIASGHLTKLKNMAIPDEFLADIFLTESGSELGQTVFDRKFCEIAVAEARKSIAEDDGELHPYVGAVVVRDGNVVATGCVEVFLCVGEQMREDLLRSFDKEAVRHAFGLVQRDGQSLGLGLASEFLRRVPVRHPGVERIEHDVAPVLIVKLFHKLAGGIVDDGAVAARIHLIKHLADDARLARAGVADNEKVFILGVAWNPQRALGIVGRNADAITGNGFRELAWTDKNRPFQPSSIPQLFAPLDVLADGKRELQHERRETKHELCIEEPVERTSS